MASRQWIALLCSFAAFAALAASAPPPVDPNLKPCGDAYYFPTEYTCYDGNFLCPIENGEPLLQCGPACYKPEMYSCSNDQLVYPPVSSAASATATSPSTSASASSSTTPAVCTETPTTQQLLAPPYSNYFYSDCHSATQIVVLSPLSSSDLTLIGPRLIVAWPAGNSGVCSFFAPENGINGTLAIQIVNGTSTQQLSPIYQAPTSSSLTGNPVVGISTLINFNSSATLTIPIMGSIRTIRDFTEGASELIPEIQASMHFSSLSNGGAQISRVWLDNQTTTQMSFVPANGSTAVKINNGTLSLGAGTYNFTATFDYAQLTQLSTQKVLSDTSQDLITQDSAEATSLTFLSYTTKLLAGAWRFLTYFGRDSMITLLLMQPVLSEGQGGAVEAIISSVLERLNHTTGQVCHEETIGDYATYTNQQNNITSNAPSCTYIMVDTNLYLAPVMENYFLKTSEGQSRMSAFFATKATTDFGNAGTTYSELATINAELVMNSTAAFAQPGGQTQDNLIHLEADQIVGEWRDSTYGIGGGRIPYDVNTALAPAALRAIAALSAAGFFPDHPEWNTTAAQYAQVWEDNTLQFFQVTVPVAEAVKLVTNYTSEVGYGFPSYADNITSDIVFHGLSLDGYNDQPIIKVMNTDGKSPLSQPPHPTKRTTH